MLLLGTFLTTTGPGQSAVTFDGREGVEEDLHFMTTHSLD